MKDFNGQDVFIDEVELDKSLDKKDILIDSILLMDCQLLPKTKRVLMQVNLAVMFILFHRFKKHHYQ